MRAPVGYTADSPLAFRPVLNHLSPAVPGARRRDEAWRIPLDNVGTSDQTEDTGRAGESGDMIYGPRSTRDE